MRIMQKSLAVLAGTFGLSVFALGQWTQRYNYTDDNNDIANCIAVDKRGNIYVAGNVDSENDGMNVVIHSYTSAGVARSGWPQVYNGAVNGDDYVTSIHVDEDLNVYVAGTSAGNSTTRWDMFVWKLDTNAQFVWPTSGGGTGYAFDSLGALRTTNTQDEGYYDSLGSGVVAVKVDMAIRTSTNPSNRTIAVTGVAKNAPGGAQGVYWRTIVFEQNSTGTTATIKTGWPVDQAYTMANANYPEAVAIHTDNSVYVTGMMYNGTGGTAQQMFTTVRYKAAGNSSSPAQHWTHYWTAEDDDDKYASGTDIVLDRDGNAFATGFIQQASVDYGTIRVPKDWDEGNPTDTGLKYSTWDHESNDDRATSIDLTFEYENDVLKPYIYVTGTSDELISTSDVGTIRYSPHTNNQTLTQVWEDVFSSSGSFDDVGMMVVGAGYGNCYVIGRGFNGDLYEDYLLLGYKRSGAARFTPIFTDGGYEALDEGRALAMAGAGLVANTGKSFGGSPTPLQDFFTFPIDQAPDDGVPDYNLVEIGSVAGGNLSDLATSNNTYRSYTRTSEEDIATEELAVVFEGASPVSYSSHPSEICIRYEGKCSISGVKMKIEVWNVPNGEYEELDFRMADTVDSQVVLVIKDDPYRYLNSSDEIKLRLSWKDVANTSTMYDAHIDRLTWDVLGP